MSDRGCFGIYKNKQVKIAYNKYDSLPQGLGLSMINFIKNTSIEQMNRIFDELVVINRGDMPSNEQIKECLQSIGLVLTHKKGIDNWYSLLINVDDYPDAISKGLRYVMEGKKFIHSHNCYLIYIINLDEKRLEIYSDFEEDYDEVCGNLAKEIFNDGKKISFDEYVELEKKYYLKLEEYKKDNNKKWSYPRKLIDSILFT